MVTYFDNNTTRKRGEELVTLIYMPETMEMKVLVDAKVVGVVDMQYYEITRNPENKRIA